MPKESKKFINPLLRPSQEAEVKGDPLARLQKSLVSEVSVLENVGDTKEIEPPPVEKFSSQTEVSSKQESVSAPLVTRKSTETETYTSTNTLPESTQELFHEGRKKPVSTPDQASTIHRNDVAPLNISTDGQRDDSYAASRSRTILSPTPASYRETFTEPLQPSTVTYTSSPTITSTNTSVETPFFVQTTQPIEHEPEERQQIRPSFRAEESVRRKKGPLAFEKTHERITLWIDKGLKQAFEELALERDLPKTALLNEAMADLLRKYDR